MGKKSRLKKQRTSEQPVSKPALMDPVLIKAYTRGRQVGYKEGSVDGAAQAMMLFNEWLQVIDDHVKGIGPKKKTEIEKYFSDRLKEIYKEKRNRSEKDGSRVEVKSK